MVEQTQRRRSGAMPSSKHPAQLATLADAASTWHATCLLMPTRVVPSRLPCYVFSVTRRSRSDESHLLTESLNVSIDFTDVTLVSEDTHRRPDPDDPEEHDDPDDHFSESVFSKSV